MQRQTKQSLRDMIQKNKWVLIGICTLIPVMYHIGTIPLHQQDFFKPHVNYLIKQEVIKQPSLK
ncbi:MULTISPECIES: hypothetical protein [Nostocales]|uniref:Uncharacterized protein n=3 Tax=Nostocales TaxID=1161 RepID=A0A0C1ND61_9CYAN|nr:hypothetical protein [Tolypothrix bouteillei]KAF3888374.1 hypothetical protein DA73_0400024945 [Tolypothrix bouteillei VB521301]